MAVPQIFPPVGQASVSFVPGIYQNTFIGVAQLGNNPALTSKNGPALTQPAYSPPVNFQQIPNV